MAKKLDSDKVQQAILDAIADNEGIGSWADIMAEVQKLGEPKNWLTEVRGPLQGLLNAGIIRRSGNVRKEDYFLL